MAPCLYCFILLSNVRATPLPTDVSEDQQDLSSVRVLQSSGEHETTGLEKRDETDQNIGPFPKLGGHDMAGKVYTVTGKRETQSDNVLVNPNRLSLSFVDAQPKLKRRTETIEIEETEGGQGGPMDNASPQRVLNLLPTLAEPTSVNSVEFDDKLVILTQRHTFKPNYR